MQRNGEQYLRGLREDHARFSRILSMIGRDARRLVNNPESVLPLFSEAVDYVVNFQNVHHHPREEIMFAKIAEKSESLAAAATRLSREHQGTDRVGQELLSMMEQVSSEPIHRPDRARLARRLEQFARAMRGHIAQEEEILYSQAWTELGPRDWDSVAESAGEDDPLTGFEDSRYPQLTLYVSEGMTRSNVSMESGPLGQLVESGMKQVSGVVDQLSLMNSTLKRQQREAWALSRKSLRAMPVIPVLQPGRALRVSMESADAFARAYVRWLREWAEVYRRTGNR
jgi:hemerythrin-like domain-containing protein